MEISEQRPTWKSAAIGAMDAMTVMTASSFVKARPTWFLAAKMMHANTAMKAPPTATHSHAERRAAKNVCGGEGLLCTILFLTSLPSSLLLTKLLTSVGLARAKQVAHPNASSNTHGKRAGHLQAHRATSVVQCLQLY